jgi:hypothetical protein
MVQTHHGERQDVVDLQLGDLVKFLQICEHKGPRLHFVCPWEGKPKIRINFENGYEESVDIELSLRFCKALIEYTMTAVERSESEVSRAK